MRIANVEGRLKLLIGDGAVDVETRSDGRFAADPHRAYDHFGELKEWAAGVSEPTEQFRAEKAGPPSPTPRQVFAVGLNYREHIDETGGSDELVLESPVIFTKYVSSFTGPVSVVELPGGPVDWETELVAVIGQPARNVPASHSWTYVAGLTVGQDISERAMQHSGVVPQFSLSKSLPGFSPTGPCLVTPDELDDPDDLGIGCAVNGELMQASRTSAMIFPVSELVSYLSGLVPLYPGDVIFTGTPAGVGWARNPQRFLQDGDHLHSWIDGVGELHQRFVTRPSS
ncbi:FAA hydrolase family protein [Mycolicibacterium sp. CH28]|uniref:fumarylacetoacetate hydrolase family protein n=1 Tax=Mycolicibacterium sp. CH28 TaxID=2512237 RepID=UPI001080E5D9|nr:fumarylacetoacetate hydrolase family protein [Mycolicibacterium sp. CH28]TGD86298.1 FAA hydrolase family protein [Mycolicibacterium sp. CH28]